MEEKAYDLNSGNDNSSFGCRRQEVLCFSNFHFFIGWLFPSSNTYALPALGFWRGEAFSYLLWLKLERFPLSIISPPPSISFILKSPSSALGRAVCLFHVLISHAHTSLLFPRPAPLFFKVRPATKDEMHEQSGSLGF